ncbi:cytochrome c oxidase subunit II [Lacimicrobium sp. SS2-24]|uniref:cytochrome c oxidase subunit II n=1 Tax=Lacimicrobium sp. SS2-24 TaxID=2005569 RepID=UPI000B4BEA68|nr:cytochrome c oxidase subunit II [Lacimicrobium sp. SS2-24]
MAFAVVLVILVLGSVLFHFLSPWNMTPLASNWGSIDVTMLITLVITAVVFIAVNFFIAYAVIKFRHTPERKAEYEPENKKLEWWLTLGTSVGIIAMLAPGLIVYADFVNVPDDAHQIEVVGQQWSWSFRFPGQDGQLGKSAIEHISTDNSFGVDPLDEAGQDDRLLTSNTLILPVNRPVKLSLRSKDVLHNFYVPNFRVKMDSVPGQVSYQWFTPTRTGDFEILCAEYCGIGHFNMRGYIKVVEQQEYEQWLADLPTFAQSLMSEASEALSVKAKQGQEVAQKKGCMACHGFEESPAGPSWLGLYGANRTFKDSTELIADDDYLREAIVEPGATIVKGYAPIMPKLELSELEVDAVIAFIKERGNRDSDAGAQTMQKNPAEQSKSGAELAQSKGCTACHSVDGSRLVGPSWQGLYNSERSLASGETVLADDAYLKESLFKPNAKVVAGYPPVMPPSQLSSAQADALIEYIKTL